MTVYSLKILKLHKSVLVESFISTVAFQNTFFLSVKHINSVSIHWMCWLSTLNIILPLYDCLMSIKIFGVLKIVPGRLMMLGKWRKAALHEPQFVSRQSLLILMHLRVYGHFGPYNFGPYNFGPFLKSWKCQYKAVLFLKF